MNLDLERCLNPHIAASAKGYLLSSSCDWEEVQISFDCLMEVDFYRQYCADSPGIEGWTLDIHFINTDWAGESRQHL